MMPPRIRTSYEHPPIPDRRWDWSAVTDDYEPGQPVGRGPTEAAAIGDLEEQLEERENDDNQRRWHEEQEL